MTRLLAVALLLIGTGCKTEVFEVPQCPSVSFSAGNVYGYQSPLTNGDSLTGEFPSHETAGYRLYAGYGVAVAPEGDVTLTIQASVSTGERALLSLYGPRDSLGAFGGCAVQAVEVPEEGVVILTHSIEKGAGGEYLLLVGASPLQESTGTYTLSLECLGDGCDKPSCPLLLGECQTDICATGFIKSLDASSQLNCPTCECRPQVCAGNRVLVVDQCVCDCTTPLTPAPVCGVNGETYSSECFAACEQVAVADEGRCEDICPGLEDCALNCPYGLILEDGCRRCECAGACQGASNAYRPVCGSDGLTYTNLSRLGCASEETGQDIRVLAMGSCLPVCEAPLDCPLSCPLGYLPAEELGPGCYQCACMESDNVFNGQSCADNAALWCSRKPVDGAPLPPPPRAPGEVGLDRIIKDKLLRNRTFINACAALSEGWVPSVSAACPSGICQDGQDCDRARLALDGTIGLLFPNAPEPPKVHCLKPDISPARLCAADIPRRCDPNASTTECPLGADCVETPIGGRCQYDCSCLSAPYSSIYDPVCVLVDGVETTLFNDCMAFCAGAWPVRYPGACCAERLTATERNLRFQERTALCAAQGPPMTPRLFLDSACPPTLAECEEDMLQCCR